MNEILEEFKIVFNLDDEPLQNNLKKLENVFGKFADKIKADLAKIFSVLYIRKLVNDFVDLNQQLGRTSSLLGTNAGEMQAEGNALKRFGGSTEEVVSSLRTMSGLLEEAKKGQGALVETARRYGISFNPMAKAGDSLESIIKQLGRFSTQQQLVIGGQLGLSDSMILASKDGGKALSELIKKQKELGVVTEEDLKVSKKLDNAQMDLKDVFNAITRDLVRLVIPSLSKMTELFSTFVDWIRKHKELVIGFFIGVAAAMAPVLVSFARMAVATAIAFAPVTAIVAVIAAVAIIAEDVYGYFMGWDSVTGDIAKKFPVIKEILEGLRPLVDGINKTFSAIVAWLKDPTWSGFSDIFKNAGKALYDFFIQPFYAFGNYFDDLSKKFSGLGDVFKGIGMELMNFITKPFKDFYDSFDSWASSVKNMASQASSFFGFGDTPAVVAPSVPQQSSVVNKSNQNNVNVNNNFNQNITTATPKQFADNTNQQIINSVNLQRQQQGALN